MTARQIEQALLQAAPGDRITLATQLIALALADDDVLSPSPAVPDDYDGLMTHLQAKRAAR
jgi:hypothetical protein